MTEQRQDHIPQDSKTQTLELVKWWTKVLLCHSDIFCCDTEYTDDCANGSFLVKCVFSNMNCESILKGKFKI